MFQSQYTNPRPFSLDQQLPSLSARSQPLSPRDKYLAALAEAKAAEAEYLAAERLQEEENSLRQRLEQIQLLKQRDLSSYYTAPQHHTRPTPSFGPDLELLRQQIAAEERARIVLEQQQARELEALRRKREEERKARELEQLRIQEARKAQIARDNERARALAAQRARLEALTERVASKPTVRFSLIEEEERRPKPHCHHQHVSHPAQVQVVAAPTPRPQPRPRVITLDQLLGQLFGEQAPAAQPKPAEKPASAPAPSTTAPETISLDQLLGQLFGKQAPAAQPKPAEKPAPAEAAPQTVTSEQLLSRVLGAAAAGVEFKQAQPSASSACTSTGGPSQAQPAEKKEAAPAPSHPAPASKPAAQTHPFDVLNQLLGGAQAQGDYPQLLNMFFGTHPQSQASKAPEASSSNSAPTASTSGSSLKEELEARSRAGHTAEDRDLAEAIRLSLSESAAPASPTSEKGKAPAPAPVADVASSTAEVHAIDASFNILAADFAFPEELDFSTSRAASPARDGAEPPSATSRLSFNARNQSVRVQHQALSALLARLDAVESFGDEGLRHLRKEAVGRVEGALEEMEQVIESRWRKWAGKSERTEAPVLVDAVPEPEPAAAEEPVVVDHVEQEAVAVDSAVEATLPAAEQEVVAAESAADAPLPATEVPQAAEPEHAAESTSASVESTSAPTSYPPTTVDVAAESVDTIRPSSPDVDTFLLPAVTESDTQTLKKPAPSSSDEDVASDWSEVDA